MRCRPVPKHCRVSQRLRGSPPHSPSEDRRPSSMASAARVGRIMLPRATVRVVRTPDSRNVTKTPTAVALPARSAGHKGGSKDGPERIQGGPKVDGRQGGFWPAKGAARRRGGLWPAKGDLYVSKSVEAEPQSRGDRVVEAEPRGGRAAGPRRQGRGGRRAHRGGGCGPRYGRAVFYKRVLPGSAPVVLGSVAAISACMCVRVCVCVEPQGRGDRAVEAEPRGGRAAEPWRQGRGGRAARRQSRRAVETGPWRQSRVEAEPQSRGDRAAEAEPRGGRAAGPRRQGRGGRAAWRQSRRAVETVPPHHRRLVSSRRGGLLTIQGGGKAGPRQVAKGGQGWPEETS